MPYATGFAALTRKSTKTTGLFRVGDALESVGEGPGATLYGGGKAPGDPSTINYAPNDPGVVTGPTYTPSQAQAHGGVAYNPAPYSPPPTPYSPPPAEVGPSGPAPSNVQPGPAPAPAPAPSPAAPGALVPPGGALGTLASNVTDKIKSLPLAQLAIGGAVGIAAIAGIVYFATKKRHGHK